MKKLSNIFGASLSPSVGSTSAAIPPEYRQKKYWDYIQTKAQEAPTPAAQAVLSGAGVGAMIGGALGGPLAAIPLGALGMLVAFALQSGDAKEVDNARRTLQNPKAQEIIRDEIYERIAKSDKDNLGTARRQRSLIALTNMIGR